jgi:hypothetical protein
MAALEGEKEMMQCKSDQENLTGIQGMLMDVSR